MGEAGSVGWTRLGLTRPPLKCTDRRGRLSGGAAGRLPADAWQRTGGGSRRALRSHQESDPNPKRLAPNRLGEIQSARPPRRILPGRNFTHLDALRFSIEATA